LVAEKVEVTRGGVIGLQRSSDGIVRYQLIQGTQRSELQLKVELWKDRATFLASPPMQSGVLVLAGDSAIFTARRAGATQTQRDHVTPSSFPLLDVAVGLEERLLRRARQTGEAAVALPTYYVASGGYAPIAHISFPARDSAALRFDSGVSAEFRVDSIGRILGGWYRNAGDSERPRVTRVSCTVINAVINKPD
jgi:hypothetical protein